VEVLADLFAFCGLADQAGELLGSLPEISPPKNEANLLTPAELDAIWAETREVADRFGYEKGGSGPVSDRG
jgi:hypothetical protein